MHKLSTSKSSIVCVAVATLRLWRCNTKRLMYLGLMNNAAKDYLDDIKARKKDLMNQLKELRDLERAIRAAAAGTPSKASIKKTSNELTLKKMIIAVLGSLGRGAEAQEIVDEIKETFNKEVKRSSLSPQLSRLKADGLLILDDKIWYLPAQYDKYLDKRQQSHDAGLIKEHIASARHSIRSAIDSQKPANEQNLATPDDNDSTQKADVWGAGLEKWRR